MTFSRPTVGQRRLARALRRLRAKAGLTIDQVADKLELSPSTISRIETAQASVRRPDVRELLGIYGVTGLEAERLLQLVEESRQQPWWQEYRDLPSAPLADLEGEAASIWQYSAVLVPGLLQTEAYASAVLHAIRPEDTPDAIQRRLQLRMERQALLTDQRLPEYRVILDEGLVRRAVGGTEVMRAQLQRLIDASALPNITLQLLPFAAGAHAGMDSEFTIFSYQAPEDPDVVYIENAGGEAYIEDLGVTRLYKSIFESLQTVAQDSTKSIQTLTDISQSHQTP
jgi:transcriptional regulator with XRE-family HTH domain